MSQKIYSDRTELEGVDLPSAGQTKMLVIDEDKKIKSEAKPTIPAQVNLIEGSNITITGTYPNLTISASGTVGTNWEDIGGDQSTVNLSGFTNDVGFITEVTEEDVTQYESALTITESQISDLGDYLESGANISELTNDVGYTTNTGTVTSVGISVPTGLEVSGSPVTTSGTIDITYESGYQGYTTAEASKLSGIEAGAQVNVKSDWNAVSGDAQILNKPTIPTKTSQLENDSGFVTSSGVTSVSGTANQIVSTGGDTPTLSLHSDIIASLELANTAIQSDDLATVATTGDYNDLDNLPTIPTKTSDLTNDSGFITSSDLPAPQSLDDVLGVGDVTDKEAKFQSGASTQYSHVNNERVISGDIEKGAYTKIDYNGIEHVPHVGRGRHNVIFTEDLDDGEFEHAFPAKSGTVAHLSDIDGAINVKMFTIELTHEQVLELNTTPYNITSTDLGLQAGEKVKWLLDRCEWKVDSNGVIYDGSIRLHSSDSPICTFSIKSDGHRAGMEIISSDDGYPVSDTHSLSAWGTITGGTSGATVKIRLYYTTTTW